MDTENKQQSSTDRCGAPTKVKCPQDITTAYVILTPGEPIDVALLRALDTLQLVVKHCGKDDVDDLCCDGHSIVVADFSGFIERRYPTVLYYGPVAIKRSVAAKKRLPYTGHSILSTILYGKTCCLKVSRENQKMCRLKVYALGGRLAESIANAHFFVTSTAAGKMYDIARMLGLKIVTPKLIEYLWQRRDQIDFELDEAHLQRFRLPVFANIKMSFHGFDESTRYQLEETAILNGAVVLVSPTSSSLVLVDPNLGVCDSDVVGKRSLGIEWFYQSLAEGFAKSFCRTDVECQNLMGSLTDERFLILVELRNSETKYVEMLGMIVGLVVEHLGPLDFEQKESRKSQETPPITKFQRLRIFLNFLELYRVHKGVLLTFEKAAHCRDVEVILEIFRSDSTTEIKPVEGTPLVDKIICIYESYLERVEGLRKYVLTLETENPPFARFLRLMENRPESGRERFVDLLMHPMQRWPRILLLLRRFAEVSADSASSESEERSYASQKACEHVQSIVERLNGSQRQESTLTRTLDLLSQIEEMPPISWSEHHALISCSGQVVKSFLSSAEVTNVPVSCFLFSHGMEIARARKSSGEKVECQPFKHIDFVNYANVKMFFIGSVPDSNHVEICYRQDEFSQEQVLLECNSRCSRDAFLSELRQLCPTFVEVHEIYDAEQKLRCESLLLQWFQTRRESNVTKTLFRNFMGNVNKLF